MPVKVKTGILNLRPLFFWLLAIGGGRMLDPGAAAKCWDHHQVISVGQPFSIVRPSLQRISSLNLKCDGGFSSIAFPVFLA